MIFAADLDWEGCCFGIVGNSSRFCLSTKVEGRNDCGIGAHAKDKFVPKVGYVYLPSGSVSGCPAVRFDASVAVVALTANQVSSFRSGEYSPRDATHANIDASTPVPPTLEETMAEYA